MKQIATLLCLLSLAMPLSAADPLPTVTTLDVGRYAGRWFEIFRLPNRFQERCAGEVTATYALLPDGKIEVLNACRKGDGSTIDAKGVARQAEGPSQPGRLEVRFAPAWLGFLPFVWGDYWIIDLAPDYGTSLIGTPDRRYLWLLSRTPQLDDQRQQALLEKARALGFDTTQLVHTRQAAP
ncbi:lipocalin family protein [Denitratisoma sp. agr-D3]